MHLEQWTPWNPPLSYGEMPIYADLYIEAVIEHADNYKIRLISEDNKHYELNFGNMVIFYKVTDEWCTNERLGMLFRTQGNDFCINTIFFKVHQSPCIQELIGADGVMPINDEAIKNIVHIVVFDGNSLIDVVTKNTPTFVEVRP